MLGDHRARRPNELRCVCAVQCARVQWKAVKMFKCSVARRAAPVVRRAVKVVARVGGRVVVGGW